LLKADLVDVNAIDFDATSTDFNDSCNSKGDCALSCACSANNADLQAAIDVEVQFFED